MFLRILLALSLALSLPLVVRADGYAFGKGFSSQLRETHQLAVINLTESTADVSMFIAIEGIPAGEEITYILPFWYQPDGFTLTEEDAGTFRKACVTPADNKVSRMQRIVERRGSTDLLQTALYTSVGLSGLLLSPSMFVNRYKGSSSTASAPLTPYAVNVTPHARAELYRIGEDDLQQLIAQSGLPEEYLQPLQKYRTPYFAVMRLKGLASAEEGTRAISERGIRYHFTHQISDGRYSYPLGTGAAWPQPIPITEVFITCPERLAMDVTAPTEGEEVYWGYLVSLATSLKNYMAASPAEQSLYDPEDLLATKTASLLGAAAKLPFAWHIAYHQSNPDQDISVELSKRVAPWRLTIAGFFASPTVPLLTCIALYLLSWFATIRLVIRRRWQRAGSPGNLRLHSLTTFLKVQSIVAVITVGGVGMAFGVPFAIIMAVLVTALVLSARKAVTDWRRGLMLSSWLCSSFIFVIIAALCYGFLYWCETM